MFTENDICVIKFVDEARVSNLQTMDKIKEKSKASASSLKHSKDSAELINKCDQDELVKRHSKKQKRKRHQSSSSSSSSSSTEIHKKRHKSKKSSHMKHHKLKRKSKKSHKRTKCDRVLKKKSSGFDESIKQHCSESDGELIGPSPAKMCTTIMKPMTKEDWDKQQSIMRHVYDSETGRQRLIKGDGEVMEEIVSYKQHQAINKKATRSDGESFQAHLGLNK